MMPTIMDRESCERLIAEKLVEIREVYHKYNPGGRYLSLCIQFSENGNGNDNSDWDVWSHSANNACWGQHINNRGVWEPEGSDYNSPLDFWHYVDIKDEKYYAANADADD